MTTPTPLPPLPPGENGSPPRQPTPAEVAAAAAFYTAVIQPWLTAITGPLLPAPRIIDPFGALTASRLWAAGMKRWITGQVLPQLRRPLQIMLGPSKAEILFDQLPYAVDYASTLQNFMVNVPNEVFAKIRAQVQTAADEGTSIPDLAGQIRGTLLDNGSAYWEGRGEMVARTELRAAAQGGLINAYTEHGNQTGIEYIKQWLNAHDTRVRPAHVDTDGQRRPIAKPYSVGTTEGPKYPAMHPGALTLPADLRINCFPGDTLVSVKDPVAHLFRRWYEGPMIRVKLENGNEISGTPNHPVLTLSGWKALKDLQVTDQLIDAASIERMSLGDPDIEDAPAPFEEIFRSAVESSVSEGISGRGVDFHGDGSDSEIEVVSLNGELFCKEYVSGSQRFGNHDFRGLLPGQFPLASARSNDIPVDPIGMSTPGVRGAISTGSGVRGGGELGSFLEAEPLHTDLVRLTPPSNLDPCGHEALAYGPSIHVESLGKSQLRFASKIAVDNLLGVTTGQTSQLASAAFIADRNTSLDEVIADGGHPSADNLPDLVRALASQISLCDVVDIEVVAFRGHVYNLESRRGWYSANGITAHNCRCDQTIEEAGERMTSQANRGYRG